MDNNYNLDLEEQEFQKLFQEISVYHIGADELCEIMKYFFLTTSTNN